MAGIETSYILRPCFADGEKAMFHRWVDKSYPIGPSARVGGHTGGQITDTLGLVEFDDGSLELMPMGKMRFVPVEFGEYAWE